MNKLRQRIMSALAMLHKWVRGTGGPGSELRYLQSRVRELESRDNIRDAREQKNYEDYVDRCTELAEAKSMSGTGPWLVAEVRSGLQESAKLREASPITSQGAMGDIELALQNLEWRREVNLSWLEFSRWGIQQLILISRLYYIKNPLIQRGINISASYVFGRGFEVSSPDEAANNTLLDFMEANKTTIGQLGLTNLDKRLYYDGQVFFVLFADKAFRGGVKVRTIDATEIQDVITNPDDSDEPWYYRRVWTSRGLATGGGQVRMETKEAWYPALNYEPTGAEKLAKINEQPVMWDSPVYHMKSGSGVSKWHFDVPLCYAALDWAKTAREFLTHCADVKAALSRIALTLTTKGGQQALEGAKQQLQTAVSSQGGSVWDQNPPPVTASIFASGPGSKLEAFKSTGAGGDPEEVRKYIHMVAMVFGLPETFFADCNTGTLATATSLDRPTELKFLEAQERWRSTLVTIAVYVLQVSKGAAGSRLFESVAGEKVRILEMTRARKRDGSWVYVQEAIGQKGDIRVRVDFPAIREGDLPQLVTATAQAMTLGTQSVIGIDEKEGVRLLLSYLGIENPDELVEAMYPESEYEPDRTLEPEPELDPAVDPQKKQIAEAALAMIREARALKAAAPVQ